MIRVQWGSDTQVYAINNEISSFDFYVLSVGSGGVTLAHDYPNEFSDFLRPVALWFRTGGTACQRI